MKSSILASLLAVVSQTFAQVTPGTNGTELLSIINATAYDIIGSTNILDGRINAFQPTLSSKCALQSAAEDLLAVIDQGRVTIDGQPGFPEPDDGTSYNLVFPFGDLNDTVTIIINDTIGLKSTLIDADVGSVVLSYIQKIQDQARLYAAEIVDRVPPDVVPVADPIVSDILNNIGRAITAYADQSGGLTTVAGCAASTTSTASSSISTSASISPSPSASTSSVTVSGFPSASTAASTSPSSSTPGSTSILPPVYGTGMSSIKPTTYTTKIVSSLTTVCPSPTTVTYGTVTYTVTQATTLTITDCKRSESGRPFHPLTSHNLGPCTVTEPVTYPTGPAAPYPTTSLAEYTPSNYAPPPYTTSPAPYNPNSAVSTTFSAFGILASLANFVLVAMF